ncbi:MAG TPA: Ldh family oxidoreductase [Pseudolabrys sp.]|nr:Ldh family oxidoreductase [Pseudolabrys sp.]
MRVPASRLSCLYSELARAHGADGQEADLFAECLLDADLRNHQTQGIGLVPYLDELFSVGSRKFGQKFEIVKQSAASALVDGHAGSGHVMSARGMDLAIELARKSGVGFVTIRNSGDCGMVASSALRAVEQGMIGISMSTGPLLVAPWGGRDVQFCTNPFSVAVPIGDKDPIVIDMATSAYSMGKVVLAARDHLKLDGRWLVDAEGNYTDDPQRVILNPMDRESAMKGALLPAGPKGFGMLLMVDLLSALLSGERTWEADDQRQQIGTDTRDRPAYYSQTLIAIDIAHFQEPATFARSAERMVETLTSLPAANGFKAIRMPGGGAKAQRASYLADGVEVRQEEWDMAFAVARKLGFDQKLG